MHSIDSSSAWWIFCGGGGGGGGGINFLGNDQCTL